MSMSDTNVIGVCNNNSSNGYLTTVVQRKMGCKKAKTRERKKNSIQSRFYMTVLSNILYTMGRLWNQSCINIIQPEHLGENIYCLFANTKCSMSVLFTE